MLYILQYISYETRKLKFSRKLAKNIKTLIQNNTKPRYRISEDFGYVVLPKISNFFGTSISTLHFISRLSSKSTGLRRHACSYYGYVVVEKLLDVHKPEAGWTNALEYFYLQLPLAFSLI